jgi:hypothetical protein
MRTVRTANPQAFAWAGLRKFQNVDLITDELMKIHRVLPKWRDDVKKQAQQLRYCIAQAREYFAAAQVVSLATKPNLLYYGTMSLALAEILFKQNGESSLDKARSEHRHHGLLMTARPISRDPDLAASAASLLACPMDVQGKRHGTFELWHRTSREHPLGGRVQTIFDGEGSSSRFQLILGAFDKRFPPLPDSGITLLDCLSSIPLMVEHTWTAGVGSYFVRGKLESQVREGENPSSFIDFILHPSPLNENLLESIRVDANETPRIEVFQIARQGFIVRMHNDWINGNVQVPFPPASMINADEWRMWTNAPSLNEFGYLYVAIFLAGNYARYYPDRWLLDVERSTPLALAIEELCALAEWRIPWLSLCELGRSVLVLES